ncbi:MAG: hypothetical protein WC375_12840 [Methanomassiliicoccales archaeon]
MKRRKDTNIDWYMGFEARASDRISELEDWDLPCLKVELEKIYDEWVNRSVFLPSELRVKTELALLSECTHLSWRYCEDRVQYNRMADKWIALILKDAEDLPGSDRGLLAVKAATSMLGEIWNNNWTLIISEMVCPKDVGHVLDIIRTDVYYHHRHSDPAIFESVDLEYRRFAIRLINGSGSTRASLRRKLTIDLHHQMIQRRPVKRRRSRANGH